MRTKSLIRFPLHILEGLLWTNQASQLCKLMGQTVDQVLLTQFSRSRCMSMSRMNPSNSLGQQDYCWIIPAQDVVKWNKADLVEPETPATASQSETIGVFNCFHCSSFTLTVFSVNSPWGTRSTASGNQVSRSATPRLGRWQF